jgi:hypothetical protein
MTEWFRQVDPRYKDCARRIMTTACFDCFIDINGWMDKEPENAFMTIGALSNHGDFYRTFKGRVQAAIHALRGRANHDMDFATKQEVLDFMQHVREVAEETWPS